MGFKMHFLVKQLTWSCSWASLCWRGVNVCRDHLNMRWEAHIKDPQVGPSLWRQLHLDLLNSGGLGTFNAIVYRNKWQVLVIFRVLPILFFYDGDDPDVTQIVLIEITDRERNCASTKHNRGAAGINSGNKSWGRKCCVQVERKNWRTQGRPRGLHFFKLYA